MFKHIWRKRVLGKKKKKWEWISGYRPAAVLGLFTGSTFWRIPEHLFRVWNWAQSSNEVAWVLKMIPIWRSVRRKRWKKYYGQEPETRWSACVHMTDGKSYNNQYLFMDCPAGVCSTSYPWRRSTSITVLLPRKWPAVKRGTLVFKSIDDTCNSNDCLISREKRRKQYHCWLCEGMARGGMVHPGLFTSQSQVTKNKHKNHTKGQITLPNKHVCKPHRGLSWDLNPRTFRLCDGCANH